MTREQAVQIIENMPISHECREFFNLALDALRQPDIVRCKDCKHYMTIHCTCDGCCISDDWFCADGERRDGEAE